jgi:nucleotide-binding universal stress UspA family protein
MALAKILVAADGSEDAALASRVAANLSAKTGAELHVVHAWHLPAMVEPAPLPFELYEEDARNILAEELGRAAEHGAKNVEGHLKRDHPVDAILDLGDELEVDLIVVGSRGHGPVSRIALGSISEGVVYRATRPVLVARGGAESWPPQRVVVGDDGSDESRRAVELASRLGHLFGARMILVRATEGLAQPRGLPESDAGFYEGLVGDARAKHVEELALRAKEMARATGTPAEIRLTEGDGATALLNACEESPATIVAVGARGRGLFRRALLGGISTKVLRAARGPVLVYATPPGAVASGSAGMVDSAARVDPP